MKLEVVVREEAEVAIYITMEMLTIAEELVIVYIAAQWSSQGNERSEAKIVRLSIAWSYLRSWQCQLQLQSQ